MKKICKLSLIALIIIIAPTSSAVQFGDYENWNTDEPNDSGGEDCALIYGDSSSNDGYWNDQDCTEEDNNEFYHGLCEVNGRYEKTSSEVEWVDARDDCENMGGHLAIIETAEDNNYIDTTYSESLWIGYNDRNQEGTWHWNAHDNWPDNEPNDSGGENCAEVSGDGSDWNDESCSDGSHDYICEYRDGTFEHYSASKTWSEARSSCYNKGGWLATPQSSSESNSLTGLSGANGEDNIGFHDKLVEAQWALVNEPPFTPDSRSPNNGATLTDTTSVTLEARYRDPEVLDGTLRFYNADNDNQIGSCTTRSNTECSVSWSVSDGSYSWYVESDDGHLTRQSGTNSFTVDNNDPPSVNSPVNPTDNEDPVALDPDLEVDVDDPDGDSLDVTFYEGSPGSNSLDTVSASSSNNAVLDSSNHNLGSSPGSSYSWSVRVDDGQATRDSSTWSFTSVGRPDSPTGFSPSDGANDVSTGSDLSVDVGHPDGLDVNVQFYVDGSLQDTKTVTGGSGTANYNPSLGYSEDHTWSVDVNTVGYSTSRSSSQKSFQTVHNTGLDSISGPTNNPAALDPTLQATVSHSDPSEELTVEFVNDDNGNVICSQSGVTDTETVTCDTSGSSFGSNTGTTYNWRVDLSGDQASESHSSGVQSFDTVSAPTVTLSSPNDGAENVATDSSLVADVSQAEGLQMKTKITLEDDQGNFIEDDSINSNNGQVSFSNPNLQLSENYQWYADTQLTDSAYSQSDTSSNRTFSTEHDFRVDGVYPSDDREAVGINDTVDVEVFHSSDRNIDVEFYFGETASGTPDVTKTVTSSGTAVNATVDTGNFDGFGEETGTTYNWSYVVSDGATDTSDITGEGLNFTTVHRPELSLNSPTDSETNVDIGGSLDIGVQQDDNIATGVTAQLNNASGSESGVATDTVIGTGAGTTASFSLDNFDFVEAGETYSYNASGDISNPADQVSSTIRSSTGINTFTVSPKPEVASIEPVDGKTGTPANPLLNVTVDHDESDQMTVEFYDWEKTGSEAFLGEETVAAGDTASINISDEEIGNSPEVYRWYVNITTESGTSWNNSADPYEFTVASIGSVDFNANTESGVNLNPDNAVDQGLDAIVGQDTIVYQVSNDVGADMPGIGFNVSNGTDSEVFGEVEDVESGSSVTADLGESSLIEEDQEGYEIFAFYQESGTDFTGEDFSSNKIEFSTHVAEVEWINPGQPGNQPINEYRVYHNNQSGQAFSDFDYVGSISDDDSGSFTAGVANLELGDSSSNECFRLVSWNVAGESNPTSEQCVGVVP